LLSVHFWSWEFSNSKTLSASNLHTWHYMLECAEHISVEGHKMRWRNLGGSVFSLCYRLKHTTYLCVVPVICIIIKLCSLLTGREILCAELFEISVISVSSVFWISVMCISFHRSWVENRI
jgi:hypothetical protein